jgi:hypothetical protein
MTPQQQEKDELLDRVGALTDEAAQLPRTAASAYRREQIDWELIRLFRSMASFEERGDQLHVLEAMWKAIETHVESEVVRQRIKQAWLDIR